MAGSPALKLAKELLPLPCHRYLTCHDCNENETGPYNQDKAFHTHNSDDKRALLRRTAVNQIKESIHGLQGSRRLYQVMVVLALTLRLRQRLQPVLKRPGKTIALQSLYVGPHFTSELHLEHPPAPARDELAVPF